MKKTITTLAAVAAVVALAGCGAGKAQEAVANAPRPTVTVTVTQPAPPAVTTTVQSVPQACLDALDNADEGFGYGAQAMTAASEFDVAALTAATTKLNRLAPTYNANKAACRTAGN